jgi:class 3 adenylate cyclase
MSVLPLEVSAMQCPTCGHENREAAKFCVRCGRGLSVSCASCGAPLPGGATFCDECGTPVKQRAGATPPDRTPRDYTPKHLAEKILTSKSALEGERKQVTVLFADVKGSLDLAEQVDPEEWHRILNRFFEILSDGVHRFEGTVNQYTGDGIMALFGAPIAHEDHAQRACYAALHLREELRRYGDALRLEQGLNFSVRMGLNSGEVIVGRLLRATGRRGLTHRRAVRAHSRLRAGRRRRAAHPPGRVTRAWALALRGSGGGDRNAGKGPYAGHRG